MKKFASALAKKLPKLPWHAISLTFLAGSVVIFIMGMVRPLLLLPTHALMGFGEREGWAAGHAARWLQGLPLYPPATDLVTNNYPPLYYMFMAGIGAMDGDIIFAGRWLTLLAFFASAALIYFIARRLGINKIAAGCGALFLLVTHARFFPYYIGINDPQWLGHAVMLAGLWVFVSGIDKRRTLIAVAIMLAAGLFKHNLIAIPLATFIWMFIYDRPRFMAALGGAFLMVASVVVALYAAFGGDFWQNMFNARVLTLKHFIRKLDHLLAVAMAVITWGAFAFFSKHRAKPNVVLLHLLVAGGFLEFFLFAAGDGVAANITFDLVIALALTTAYLVHHVMQNADAKLQGAMLALLSLLFFVQMAAWPETKFIKAAYDAEDRAYLRERARQVEQTIACLQKTQGNAWCQNASFCYWAGKPVLFDQFNVSQRILTGDLTQDTVRGRFKGDKIKVLQIDDAAMATTRPARGLIEETMAAYMPRNKRNICGDNAAGAVYVGR